MSAYAILEFLALASLVASFLLPWGFETIDRIGIWVIVIYVVVKQIEEKQ